MKNKNLEDIKSQIKNYGLLIGFPALMIYDKDLDCIKSYPKIMLDNETIEKIENLILENIDNVIQTEFNESSYYDYKGFDSK